MPIIDHRTDPPAVPAEGRSSRRFITKDTGAASLTVGELVMHDGAALRLHTHPHDEAIILLEGSIEMVVGDETSTVTSGHTLLAPPGVPHRLVNSSGADAKMYTVMPTDNPSTDYVD
jgi:quercetin dioxygenase-like cupin family protein